MKTITAITMLLLLLLTACTPAVEPLDSEGVQDFCDANVDYRILRACTDDNEILVSLGSLAQVDIEGIVGAIAFEEGEPQPIEITGFVLPPGLDGELSIKHDQERTPTKIILGPIVNENGAPTLCIRKQQEKEITSC